MQMAEKFTKEQIRNHTFKTYKQHSIDAIRMEHKINLLCIYFLVSKESSMKAIIKDIRKTIKNSKAKKQ